MKSLFYIVLVCILPLCGYGQLFPNSNQKKAFYSPAKSLQRVVRITASASRLDEGLIVESIPCDAEKENSKIEIAENEAEEDKVEDDDVATSKKYLQHGDRTAFIFFAQTFGYFVSHTKKAIPFYQSISNISSCQYLIYQVFRI